MTKSTGKRAIQRKREQLFSAELTLRRVLLHLGDAMAWAEAFGAHDEWRGRLKAYGLVFGSLLDVLEEVKGLA